MDRAEKKIMSTIRKNTNKPTRLNLESSVHPGSPKKRFALLTLIMFGVSISSMLIVTYFQYRHALEENGQNLRETVEGQAQVLQAIYRFNLEIEPILEQQGIPFDPLQATIARMSEAKTNYELASRSMEFTLATRNADEIVFLINHRHGSNKLPQPIRFDEKNAEPQRRALQGKSGILTGLDYRGETVLAAYQYVDNLQLGLVAKIDKSEIIRPFLMVVLVASSISLAIILLGVFGFVRISNPLLKDMENYAKSLEREVQQRKRIEERLVEQKTHLDDVLEGTNAGTWDWNIETGEVQLNERWAEIAGTTLEELSPINIETWTTLVHPLDLPLAQDALEKHFSGESDYYDVIFRQVHKRGATVWVHARGKVVERKADGSPVRMSGTHLDITSRKLAMEEREQLSQQLRAKNKELEQVVYVASHDLRSPLVNIDGYSKELGFSIEDLKAELEQAGIALPQGAVDILEGDIPECLHYIHNSASKMDTLLNGLLVLSRSGRSALKLMNINMQELLQSVVDDFEFECREADIEVELKEVPPCWGDSMQLNQIFANLLSNAIKYRCKDRKGHVEISGYQDGDLSIFRIQDNGVGMKPEHLAKIFEIFHRLNPNDTEGEGLGLTIVKRILGRLNGSIQVESEPGKGSIFKVQLPIAES